MVSCDIHPRLSSESQKYKRPLEHYPTIRLLESMTFWLSCSRLTTRRWRWICAS